MANYEHGDEADSQKQASRGRDTNNCRQLKQYRGGSWELRAGTAREGNCLVPSRRVTYTFNPGVTSDQ